jgi:uncharacterized membrane protein
MSEIIKEQQYQLLNKRVENLESMVKELQQILLQSSADLIQQTPNVTGESALDSSRPKVSEHNLVGSTSKPRSKVPLPPPPIYKNKPNTTWKSEFLLNKIGIGLLLLGIVFMFKFSIDQGWITPALRVVFGLVLGTGLLFAGFPRFSLYNLQLHFVQ